MNRNTEYDEIHGIETDLDKEFGKEFYQGVANDIRCKKHDAPAAFLEVRNFIHRREQEVRKEVVAEIMKSLDFTAIYDGIYHKRGDILRILRKALSNTKNT